MILYYYIHLIADTKVGQPILMRAPVKRSLRLLGEQTPSPLAYKTPEKLQEKRQGTPTSKRYCSWHFLYLPTE